MKGTFQFARVNNYGFPSIKVNGEWYGGDKKGAAPKASEGQTVEFEDYKNPKGYNSFKVATFRVSSAPSAPAAAGVQQPTPRSVPASGGTRDSYWADKEANDKAKDPRISYFASYERAVQFADLAIRNGAFDALAKVKKNEDRLEVLEAFVDEQAARIMAGAYSAETPLTEKAAKVIADVTVEAAPAEEGTWS